MPIATFFRTRATSSGQMKPIRTPARAAVMIAAVLAVVGCTSFPRLSEQPDLYTLSAPSSPAVPAPSVSWQMLVDTISAPASLDAASIAGRQQPASLDYYDGVAWTDRAPVMIQRLLIETFENSGRITGIGRDSLAIRANYIMRCELRDFQADSVNRDSPVVMVRTSCALIRMPDRDVVARTTHEGQAAAGGTRFPLIIDAFDRALDDVLTQIVQWALTTGQADFIQQ